MLEAFWHNTIVAHCTRTRQLSGKTPLLLDDPAAVWAVLEGRVELYAVRVREGRPVGARRHLCTVEAGDVLFGLDSTDDPAKKLDADSDKGGLALLAAGLPGTRVGLLDAGQLLSPLQWAEGPSNQDRTDATARLVDRFLLGVCAGLSRDIAPRPGQRTDLENGMVIAMHQDARRPSSRIIRPGQGVWWLRQAGPSLPESGVRYLGLEDVKAAGAILGCVLTPETWAEVALRSEQAARDCSLEVLDTRTVLAGSATPGTASGISPGVLPDTLSNALARFGELFPCCLDLEMRLADADVYTALHARAQAARRAREAGLQRLRGVLDQGRKSGRKQDAPGTAADVLRDPLHAAAAKVLRATGVAVREDDPPQAGGGEPGGSGWAGSIGDIAAAWGVRHRMVSLGPGWWKRDGGPLLGFRDPDRAGPEEEGGDPVALLQPGPGRYVAHDPARGTRTAVSAANAASFSARAVSFYRPFPDKPLGALDLIRFALFGSRRDFLFMLGCGLALALLAVLPPVAVKLIFSEAIPTANRFFLAEITAMLVVVAVSAFAVSLTRIAALQRMAGRMDFQLEPALWERLISLPATFYRREAPGELADRADGLNIVRVRLCDTFLTTLLSGIFAASNVAMLFVFSPRLALPALGMLLLGALIGAIFNLRQVAGWRTYFVLQGRISARLVQFFSGLAKIRMSGAEDRVFSLWAEDFARQQTQMLRTGKEQNRLLIFNMLFPVAAMTVLFFLAAGLSGPGALGVCPKHGLFQVSLDEVVKGVVQGSIYDGAPKGQHAVAVFFEPPGSASFQA